MKQVQSEQPKVSVIISCYNYADYISDAIESVYNQTYKNLEVIVINDGSSDGSDSIIKKLKSRRKFVYIDQNNKGIVYVRNKGLELASGEYILQLDADDTIPNNYVSKLVASAEKHKLDIAYTPAINPSSGEKIIQPPEHDLDILKTRNYIHISALFRSSTIKKYRYDVSLNDLGLEDWDMNLSLCLGGARAKYIKDVALNYNQHPELPGRGKRSRLSTKNAQAIVYILDKHIQNYPNNMSDMDWIKQNISRVISITSEQLGKIEKLSTNLDAAQMENEMLTHRIADLNHKLTSKSHHLEAIVTSRSYRVCMLFVTPLSKVANLARRCLLAVRRREAEMRRTYTLYHTPNIKSLYVGSLLYSLYGVRRRYFGLRIAIVSRGMYARPTSSAWIRLFSPLTHNGYRYRLSFYSSVAELDLKNVDVCIVQRTALNSEDEAEKLLESAKHVGVKIILDVDDAFLDLDTSHPQYDEQKRWIEALRLLINEADQLWVSTDKIKEQFGSRSEVFLNSVDDRIWKMRESELFTNNKIKILYMGTGTHHEDFKMILKDFDEVNDKYEDSFELTLIGVGSGLPERPWLIKKKVPKRDTIYPRFASWLVDQEQYDIGIAPLVDSAFNRSKSDIKVLDYLCCGVVPIVSDIEPYKSKSLDDFVVRVGYKEHSWYSVIEDVILNKEKYASLKESNIENIRNYLLKDRSVSKVSEQMHQSLMRVKNSSAREAGDELL